VIGEVTTSSSPPSGAAKARLLRRAQAVARLRHPNLVRMLPLPGGAGLAPVLNNAKRLADFTLPAGTFKRFDLEQVVRLLLDVLSGLAALHEIEVDGSSFVHAEVSPSHIYVDEHGTARLVPLMNAHMMVGAKPEATGYVAPERLLGERFDARADVFSVGVMLWEALSGQRLFPDASLAGVVARCAGRLPAIRLAPRLKWAEPLCAIAERAIAVDPEARFRSVLELSHAMEASAAQQLSTVDTDAWQEEAPTPVFQPNLHLAKLRTSTPPPSVLDLEVPKAIAAPPPLPAAAPPAAELEEARSTPTDVTAPLEAWQSGRRGRGVVLGLAAVVLGAVALLAPRAPGMLQEVRASGAWPGRASFTAAQLRRVASAASVAPTAALAPEVAPAPAPSARAAGAVPISTGAPSSSSAVPSSSSSSSAVPSVTSAASAATPSKRAGPVPRQKPKAPPPSSDYGI
jgi:eukaryotic-like serine/threonine-protein kinase